MTGISILRLFSSIVLALLSITVAAEKRITVDLDRQFLTAYQDGQRVYEFHAVTGSCAKWTHPGTYQIDRKVEDYVSQTYDVEMPYSMFFTTDGKAIHGTSFATIRSFLHAYVSNTVGSKTMKSLLSIRQPSGPIQPDTNSARVMNERPKGTTFSIGKTPTAHITKLFTSTIRTNRIRRPLRHEEKIRAV